MTNLDAAPAVDRLPTSAWVMAWLFLVGQIASLMARGVNPSDAPWVVASMLLSALIVRWFAEGVLRARTERLVIVWVALSVATSLSFVGLMIDAVETTGADLLTFVFTAAQLVALGVFCSSDYFKHCRADWRAPRAALAPVLLIAVATGAIGGLTASTGGDVLSVQLNVGF